MGSTDRIEKEIFLKAPIEKVWAALGDAEAFGTWFRFKADGPFVAGQATTGHITYPGYEHLRFTLWVEALEAPHRLAFRWHPNAVEPDQDYGDEPTTLVEFRLEAEGEGTRLRLVESGYDALPEARRAEAWRNNEGGWTEQMANVRAFVEGPAA